MSLRVPLSDPELRALGLIQPKWRHQTPGMAAGLTDHVTSHGMWQSFSLISWQYRYVFPCDEAPRLRTFSRIIWQ